MGQPHSRLGCRLFARLLRPHATPCSDCRVGLTQSRQVRKEMQFAHVLGDGIMRSAEIESCRDRCHSSSRLLAALLIVLGWTSCSTGQQATRTFQIELDPSVASQATTGRLFVFLSQRPGGEPRRGPDWFAPEPFFATDVADFQPGETRVLTRRPPVFPAPCPRCRREPIALKPCWTAVSTARTSGLRPRIASAALNRSRSATSRHLLFRCGSIRSSRMRTFPAMSGFRKWPFAANSFQRSSIAKCSIGARSCCPTATPNSPNAATRRSI